MHNGYATGYANDSDPKRQAEAMLQRGSVLGASTPQPSPVQAELTGLRENLGALHAAIEELRSRLAPVLDQRPQVVNKGETETTPRGELAGQIRSAAQHAYALRENVSSLLGDLVL